MRAAACLALALALVIPRVQAAQVPSRRPTLSVRGEPAQPGSVLDLIVRAADGLRDPRGTAFGRPLAFAPGDAPQLWHALVGVDVSQAPGPATIQVEFAAPAGRPVVITSTLIVQPRTFTTRQLRVAGQFVDPSPDELERIRAESDRLERLFAIVTPRAALETFALPLAGVPGSNFGTRSVFNGQPRAPHAGVDFRGITGTPIAAPGAGRVVLAEPLFFTGETVVLDHGLGLYSLLAHLSRIDVTAGQSVDRGAIVGRLGATGRVTGPHLHWAVRLGGARVDALRLLALLTPAQPGNGRVLETSPDDVR